MFEFKGTTAASKEGTESEWRLADHKNIQNLGRRPFTTMVLPTTSKPSKAEGPKRPSPPLRSRSNSFAPTYTRPSGTEDLAPVATSIYRPTPRLKVDRRSIAAGSTHTRGDSFDIFTPKVWMAKGSKLLKRENSKHQLTSLRTLDWTEEKEAARAHYATAPPSPSEFRRSRVRATSDCDSNAASPLSISEPFNFQHITHTQPHQVRKLDSANPEELVSEFSALRASQASQPELRGINAKDIQREDLPRDALLPDCPSQLPDRHVGLSRSKSQEFASDSAYGAMSPAMALEYSRLNESFSHPCVRYYTGQTSPTSPSSQTSSHHPTSDAFTFHDESPSDTTLEPIIPTESPESLDDPLGTWDDGLYDLAPPHAVSTDENADWNRQVPFSMVRTELAPVEEEEEEVYPPRNRPLQVPPLFVPRTQKYFPNTKTLHRGSDAHTSVVRDPQGQSSPSMPSAGESVRGSPPILEDKVSHSPQKRGTSPTMVPEPFIEDQIDDIPMQARFSRCISIVPNDMERFWAMASDAINCSYALGAECDSNFDWHRWSVHEDDTEVPTADPEDPHSLSEVTIKRSSSVYSNSSIRILPLQTSPAKLEPPSASSTTSSSSSFPGAITPNESTESPTVTRFPAMNSKEWCRPAYIVPNDLESQAIQEDLYHQLYAGDYSQETPLQIQNVGRVDGSTISNSPRSSRSPISKSSSQESFWFSQSGYNTRRPRNAGSVGSLPELVSGKNSRERFECTADQFTENASPNLTKDPVVFKVRTAEEPLPPLPASRSRANSDVTSSTQDLSSAPPAQPAGGRRMRSGSSASNPSARSSRASQSMIPVPTARKC